MNKVELRAASSLAAVFSARLLGLFMIYPVFAAYAGHLRDSTPLLIGLSLGAYGLTQGLLQLPFGLLSDRIGRKQVIVGGLILFAIGSAVAAASTSITGVLLGRVLQGTGAIGSTVLALVADLTSEESRTKAMALVGMTIGLSFAFAIVAGPALAGVIGVAGIFWLTAILAFVGIAITLFLVPRPVRKMRHRDAEAVPALIGRVLRDRELLRLDFAIFALHAVLTASFLAVPQVLSGALGLTSHEDWRVYLPVLAASVVLMVPVIILAEKRRRMKEVFLVTILLLGVSQLALWLASAGTQIGTGVTGASIVIAALIAFFTAFNIMEASLPSLITKTAPPDAKGTATGIFSSAQFLGIFVGGALGGGAYGMDGLRGVFLFTLGVTLLWLIAALGMRRPGHYSSYLARLGTVDRGMAAELAARLDAVPGVIEAVVVAEEGIAYLKIDRARFDAAAVGRITGQLQEA